MTEKNCNKERLNDWEQINDSRKNRKVKRKRIKLLRKSKWLEEEKRLNDCENKRWIRPL